MLPPLLRSGPLRRFLILLALGWAALAPAQAQTPFFNATVSVGSAQGQGESWVNATATDAQGNVYVTGQFAGRISFGSQQFTARLSQFDVFVAKYDAAGNYVWAVTGGGDAADYARGLALDASGNVYITGTYATEAHFGAVVLPDAAAQTGSQPRFDVFVAKLDAAGNWLWATHGGGLDDESGAALALDASGNVVLVGDFFSTTATFGATQLANAVTIPHVPGVSYTSDIFMARLAPNGNWLNAAAIGGPGTELATGLALDAAGNAYLCGSFSSATIGLGSTTLTNADPNTSDAFTAKLTPAGTWLWAARAGGTGADRAQGIAVDASGLVYLTGGFGSSTAAFGSTTLLNAGASPNLDIFVASLDASGAWRWATRAGGADGDGSSAVAVLPTGGVIVTGEFLSRSAQFGATTLTNSSGANKSDAYIARLDAAGAWQWALATTGPEDESAQAVTIAPDGGACVVGNYAGQARFGPTTLTTTTYFANGFLTKVYDNVLLRVTSLAPSSGAPGQTVTITGSGFVGATAVLFNGTPAASFAVQSGTQLTAVVPAGATTGPISVQTGAGTASSPTPFQPTVLSAASGAREAAPLQVWPNPVGSAESLQLQLADAPAAPTRFELRNVLGQVVRAAQFSGRATNLPLRGLAPGVYQLLVYPAGQPALLSRVLVN